MKEQNDLMQELQMAIRQHNIEADLPDGVKVYQAFDYCSECCPRRVISEQRVLINSYLGIGIDEITEVCENGHKVIN